MPKKNIPVLHSFVIILNAYLLTQAPTGADSIKPLPAFFKSFPVQGIIFPIFFEKFDDFNSPIS